MLTNWLTGLGVTRDSAVWFWGRLVSGATLVLGLGPMDLLDPYLSEPSQKWLTMLAVLVLWLSGKFDSSPLPAGKK
jgi:hypothetical protein